MNWDDFRQAFSAARNTMNQADHVANDIADMLDGRLKKVSSYRLAKLKRQLRDFNMHTGEWRDESDPSSNPASLRGGNSSMSETLLPMKAPFDRPAKEGVSGKVGMAAPTIYELIRKGEFPVPVKRGRSSLWIESEIDAWIVELKEERDRERSAA